MKTPRELTRRQLEQIVTRIQSFLWLDTRHGAFVPDVEWSMDTVEGISGVLEEAGLKPGVVTPVATADTDRAPSGGDRRPDCPRCGDALRCGSCGHEGPREGLDEERTPRQARPGTAGAADLPRDALVDFVRTVEATGGCVRDEGDYHAPATDPDWIDLGDAYLRACAALGRTPLLADPEDDGAGLDADPADTGGRGEPPPQHPHGIAARTDATPKPYHPAHGSLF